jgi:hypothetical protein
MYKGFVQLRRGILEHIERGDMSFGMFSIYRIMLLQANHAKGVWWRSAPKLWFLGPRDRSVRAIQNDLRKLEESGYLKSGHVKGRRGNFPVLVNRFYCADGPQKGKHLNADRSTDYRNPVYEFRDDDCNEATVILRVDGGETDSEATGIQELGTKNLELREKKEPLSAHPALNAFKVTAESTFKQRFGSKPSWGAKDFVQLANLMRRHMGVSESEFVARWIRYLTDSEPFVLKQGHSLSFFCSKFDSYMAVKRVPILPRLG